ncbi:MAG: hypothetical protein IJ274_08785 [Lachnospiraceae bacterium]|nr:hypothetical protein [Lachnospiraceae bacterium]
MKKRAIILVLMMVLALVMTACGNDGGRGRGHDTSTDDIEDTEDETGEPDEDKSDVEEPETEEPEQDEKGENNENTTVNTPSELSDDLYSFQVSVDGTVYQFPMWASDFKALGWTYDGDGSNTLTANQYTTAETWVKEDAKVYTSLINLTMNSVTYEEAAVGGITFEEFYLKDCDMEIILPKGIQYKVSSRDEIIAAYGEPSSEYEGDLYYKMTYKYDSYQEVNLYVFKETGTMDKIEIRNFVELEGGDNSVDPTVPDVVKNYQAPSELGDDLYAFNIQLEGNLYTLPCPVSVLVENGFKINEANSQMEIAADSYGWVELSYNNQTYRCIVDNYADYATIVQNCFVTTMETSIYGPKFELVIPGEIKRGDTESSMLEKIKKFNYEVSTSGDFTYYEVTNPEGSPLAGYEISVKEGEVISIDVSYDD